MDYEIYYNIIYFMYVCGVGNEWNGWHKLLE